MKGTVSVSRAIRVGLLRVNGPVFVLLVGPLGIFALAVKQGVVSRHWNWVGLPVFLCSFVLAWLWWSYAVPRWRLWAYERVSDIAALKERAVAVGLTWPDGHAFGRTELKSARQRARERELDPERDEVAK
jgi:hypothetical protein